jgi:signal transduction histidine kinase
VTLVSSMPDEPLIANVDADLLKQAALNVIQNGAQAMPEGGRLDVVLEGDQKIVAVTDRPAGWRAGGPGDRSAATGWKSALLRIADQGPGIPDEIREKIFDLYFTTKTGGSGIGLAMTYRILQLHHGSVEVQSERDRGAEFRLRIPLAATEWGRWHPRPAVVQDEKGLAG